MGKVRFIRLTILGMAIFVLAQTRPADIPTKVARSVRVQIEDDGLGTHKTSLANQGFDILRSSEAARQFEVIITPDEYPILYRSDIPFSILESGRPFYDIQRELQSRQDMNYPDLDQIEAQLQQVAAANPEIAMLVDVSEVYGTPSTAEGRHQFILKISDNVNTSEDEPSVLIVSAFHSRELGTPVITLYAIEQLTSLYATDAEVKAMVDNNEIWIAPVWNPDGYVHVFTGDNMWRKNRRVLPDAIGVDLNRNYPIGWEDCGGSSAQSSESYKGDAAGSEAETQTMMALSEAEDFIKVIDFHNAGQFTMWGYSRCSPHPFSDWLEEEASALGDEAGYSVVREAGNMSLHFHWQLSRGALASVMETEQEFQPPYERAEAEAVAVWPAIKYMIQKPVSIHGHVTDNQGNALEAGIELVGVEFNRNETFASSGPFGRYDFMLPPGSYTLRFSLEGYVTRDTTVAVTADVSQLVDIVLGRPGEVGVAPEASRKPLMFYSHQLNPATTGLTVFSLEGKRMLSVDLSEQTHGPGYIRGPEPGVYMFRTDLGVMGKFVVAD